MIFCKKVIEVKITDSWQVVVMRPQHQSQHLLQAIQQLGFASISLPILNITPRAATPADIKQWCDHVIDADIIIVSSQNAVHFAPKEVLTAMHHTKAKVITMGQATSNSLIAKGVSVFFTPLPGSDSEALLSESCLQSNEVANKKILLLAGEGGRTVLAETLTARGALVEWSTVYQQEKRPLALASLLASWTALPTRFCFIVTSLNSLEHFLNSVPAESLPWVQQQAFIVISERIAQVARKWEIQHIFVAKGAHQEQLCATLLHVTQFCHTMT